MAQKNGPGAGDTGRQKGFSLRHANNPTNNRSTGLPQAPIRAELSGSTVCIAAGIKVDSGSPVLAMCQKLIAAGYDPTTPLHAYRGDTLCLTVRSIGDGAKLRIGSHGVGFEAAPSCGAGPPARLNDRATAGCPGRGSSLGGGAE
jgi:hypothetical protein